MSQNQIFGEIYFISKSFDKQIKIQSLEISHLAYLSYSNFRQVLEQYPEDVEKFHELKDLQQIYQNMDVLKVISTIIHLKLKFY